MTLLPYRPEQFTRKGQAYLRLQERCKRLAATQFAGERFDAECSSKYRIEDIVLAKFNMSDRKRPRVKKPGERPTANARAKQPRKARP